MDTFFPPLLLIFMDIKSRRMAPVIIGEEAKIALLIINKFLHFDKVGPYNETAESPVKCAISLPKILQEGVP